MKKVKTGEYIEANEIERKHKELEHVSRLCFYSFTYLYLKFYLIELCSKFSVVIFFIKKICFCFDILVIDTQLR